MRNLRKVLSLSLALIMLLGMMIVGAGAATYADAEGSANEVAIDVTSAISVFQGTGNGFNPEKTLSRAEAATIVARMLYTKANVDKMAAIESSFADVNEQAPWAAGAIEACVNEGIVAGDGAGNFNPAGEVTGFQFAKMVLLAVGYADESRYLGANWAFNALQDIVAAKLDEGIDTAAISDQPLKREAAAQMALNALVLSPKGDETTYIVTGIPSAATDPEDETARVTLYSGSSRDVAYMNLTTAKSSAKFYEDTVKLGTTTVNVDSLGQKTFGLTVTKVTDELGRTVVNYHAPAYRLDMFVTEAADYVFEGFVSNATMYATVGRDVVDGYDWNTMIDGVYADSPTDKPVSYSGGAFQGTDNGMITEVYVHNDTKKVDVLIRNTYLSAVSKVVEAKNGNAAYVVVDGMKWETEEYEKGDVVLYTREGYTLKTVELAPELTGTLTQIVLNKQTALTFTIDGKDYEMSAKGDDTGLAWAKLGTEVTCYLDTQGNIMEMKGVIAGVGSYIYVAANSAAKNNPDYITNTNFKKSVEVYGVNASGEIIKLDVAEIDDVKIGNWGVNNDNTGLNLTNVDSNDIPVGLYTYSGITAGSNVKRLVSCDNRPTTTSGAIAYNRPSIQYHDAKANADKWAVANSETIFIYINQPWKASGNLTITNVTMKTGIANIDYDIASSDAWLGVTGRVAEVVFVTRDFDEGNTAAGVVYIKANSERQIQAWQDETRDYWYTYKCVDESGDTVTLTSRDPLCADDGNYAGKIYQYDEDNFIFGLELNGTHRVNATSASKLAVTAVKGSTFWLDTIAQGFNNVPGETSVVFVDGVGANVEAGQVATVVTKSGNPNSAYAWDAQVVFVTSAASESVDVRPVKSTDTSGATPITHYTAEVGSGVSFTATGNNAVTDIQVDGNTPVDVSTVWGLNTEYRGFTFAGTGSYTLTIWDEDGYEVYQETKVTSTDSDGFFVVQIVNLTSGQTSVSNPGSYSLAALELDDDTTYSWTIEKSNGSIVANGSFYVGYNGVNP